MPRAYDRGLGEAVFRPFAVDLARRAARGAPSRVLELAAGTGVLTRELVAALPEARITATDLNAAMVEAGGAAVPGPAWERVDAQDLPYPDAAFDLVTCQFGVMFLPDRPAAYAQARRVLAPEGRLLFNTWDTVAHHRFAEVLVAALDTVLPDDPPSFINRVPHGYTDVEQVVADVRAGGLDPVTVETIDLVGRAESAADVAIGFCTGTPLRIELAARGDLRQLADAVAREMTDRLGRGPVTGRMRAHVVEALR